MKNQSGTIKTNLELYRVVMGGSGGFRRLTVGSDDFLLQTDKQTLHHYIYIMKLLSALLGFDYSLLAIQALWSKNRRPIDSDGPFNKNFSHCAYFSLEWGKNGAEHRKRVIQLLPKDVSLQNGRGPRSEASLKASFLFHHRHNIARGAFIYPEQPLPLIFKYSSKPAFALLREKG